jgi:hypothetical protein
MCFWYLRKATKELKEMIQMHRELCERSLLSLKELLTSVGNITLAEIIRKIMREEYHDQDLAIVCAIKDPTIPSQPSKTGAAPKTMETH